MADPLRCYIAVYDIKGELRLSGIAFQNETLAWTKPRGPNVPAGLEVVHVIKVEYPHSQPSSEEGN